MTFLIAYVTVLVVFGIIDALWLWQMADTLYRPVLGDMLAEKIRMIPALVFYLLFPVGVVVFAVLPAHKDGSVLSAFALGALLGALCYATYDLTNYATLKQWSLQITVIDIAYGAVVTGICATAAFYVLQMIKGS